MKEWIIVQAENSFVNSVANSFAKKKKVSVVEDFYKSSILTKKKM